MTRYPSGKKLPITSRKDESAGLGADTAHEAVVPHLKLVESLPGGVEFLIHSPHMRTLRRFVAQVASSDAPVLIDGESGTGKELFARLIHALSTRKAKPYVPVNCGVLRGELFADKFFGHEPGAFTGATRLQKGSFELAGDGTLFMDEVGEIPQANQVDFLRVLEERCFRRLGGQRDLPFSARIVAATNRKLPEMVAQGSFRADLFYRLNVIPLSLPPLRERREEIAPLALHFLEAFCHRYHKQGLSFTADTLQVLRSYSWPGNVRELKNLVERLVLLHEGGVVTPAALPLEMDMQVACGPAEAGPACLSLDAAVKEAEIRAIRRAVKAASGNRGEAARMLQISPRTLRLKVSQYGLRFNKGAS